MALVENGLATLDGILHAGKEKIVKILRNEQRTTSLLSAIADAVGLGPNRYAKSQIRVAKQLGLEQVFTDCNTKLGTEYEIAVLKVLEAETSWSVTLLDDGKRKNVPDIMITLDDLSVLLECKTCIKQPALIKKEEAFAVLQKGSDFESKIRRVTLGKPMFDEHSKLKAQASSDISLVEHPVFIEGILRLHTGSITATDFLKWLGTPGVTEISRLGGKPTYAVD